MQCRIQRRIQQWLALSQPVKLDLSGLQLDALPPLPQLAGLDCSFNHLTALGPLPTSLESLVCACNLLRALTRLPRSLEFLSCQGNPLQTMRLPAGLKHLYGTADTWPALPPGLLALKTAAQHIGPLPPGLRVLCVWTRSKGALAESELHIRQLPDRKPPALREFGVCGSHRWAGNWERIVRRLHTEARHAVTNLLPTAALLYV